MAIFSITLHFYAVYGSKIYRTYIRGSLVHHYDATEQQWRHIMVCNMALITFYAVAVLWKLALYSQQSERDAESYYHGPQHQYQ